ncbi:MAG: hypothetical protein GC154_11930 [bacterium]|nr:hypothetical protein [bacterium]
MTTIANAIASILAVPGEALRQFALLIPMWMAKGCFILYFAILIAWVWLLPREEMVGPVPGRKKPVDLRIYATASMVGMIIIYLIF